MTKKKLYYSSTCGKLFYHIDGSDVYVHKNTIKKSDKRMSKVDFDELETTKIKKDEFNRLMNVYFRDIKETWTHDGEDFMSLDNFETTEQMFSSNYKLGIDVPYHNLNEPGNDYFSLKHLLLVYYKGKVYYHTVSYGGYKQGQLMDIKTHKLVSWCQLKHCAPIFNKTKKIII